MATISIDTTGPSKMTSGVITWSRTGFYDCVVVLGGRIETETSLFKDTTSFNDNVQLKEMWTGTPSKATKESDGSTADAYVKFATDPDDGNNNFIDGNDVGAIYAYRELTNLTQQYTTGAGASKEQISAFGMILDVATWKFTGKKSLNTRVQQPIYVKFQGDRGKEHDNKDLNKFCTCTVKGYAREIVGSDLAGGFTALESGEYKPFRVLKADRFKKKTTYSSFRNNPTVTSVDLSIRDDRDDLIAWAQNSLTGLQVPNVSGSITLVGPQYWTIGDIVDKIKTENGEVTINLAAISIPVSFAGLREGDAVGAQPDTTTITLGRV